MTTEEVNLFYLRSFATKRDKKNKIKENLVKNEVILNDNFLKVNGITIF